MQKDDHITGIIPAAGYARRLAALPCSKEIYPVGFDFDENTGTRTPSVVSTTLLNHFSDAGVRQVYFIIRKGKWDIPDYFGTGDDHGLHIAYLVTGPTPGTPFTTDLAYPFVKGKRILFGFPDIIIKASDPFQALMKKMDDTGWDIVLGLFEADNPQKADMVETDESGLVRTIVIKPDKTDLTHTWLLAVWNPAFTEFLHTGISALQSHAGRSAIISPSHGKPELFIGDFIQKAINSGIKVGSVRFPGSAYVDIGTPDDLKKAASFTV
jgi:dTDP-glucose pyrophosphorylase